MSSKLRKALSDACYAMFNFLKTQNSGYEEMAIALDKAKAALAAPPRNCDVGTVEEQTRRMEEEYCTVQKSCYESPSGRQCPLYKAGEDCRLIWAQMLYKKGRDAK